MNDIYLTVEAAAGSDIPDVIRQMCQLSTSLRVAVQSKLNGVTVVATPYCDLKRLREDWWSQLGCDRPHKIVVGQPVTLGTVPSASSARTS